VKASNIEELLFSTSWSRVGGEGGREAWFPSTEPFFRNSAGLCLLLHKGSLQPGLFVR
jgi:hypothetical protein